MILNLYVTVTATANGALTAVKKQTIYAGKLFGLELM